MTVEQGLPDLLTDRGTARLACYNMRHAMPGEPITEQACLCALARPFNALEDEKHGNYRRSEVASS